MFKKVENEMKIVRTHDHFYADVDVNAQPKFSFISVAEHINKYKKSRNDAQIKIVDFGCAAGAFVNYLNYRFPFDDVIGIEYLDLLVNAAKLKFPNANIKKGSILDRSSLEDASVDIITCLGVLCIFDDIEPIISNINHWIKPGGKVLIQGMFNQDDVDVFVKYRKSECFDVQVFEAGWNIVSQKTISNLLKKYGAISICFHKFIIPFDLHRDISDPLRSWTEKLIDGERQIINATCLKQPHYILEVDF